MSRCLRCPKEVDGGDGGQGWDGRQINEDSGAGEGGVPMERWKPKESVME
jgi:hypothetical protein